MNKNTKKIDNESEAIRENWYCLAICILRGCTPEQAFGLFSSGKKPPIRLNEDDYKIIKKYRDYGCTWVEIGRLYGLPDSELLNRIKHYKNSRLKNVAS